VGNNGLLREWFKKKMRITMLLGTSVNEERGPRIRFMGSEAGLTIPKRYGFHKKETRLRGGRRI